MRIVSWAVILGSSLALYLGGIRPMAEQWRAPLSEIWSDLEANPEQAIGAVVDPAETARRSDEACDSSAGNTGSAQARNGQSDGDPCLESAVARH